MNYCADPDWVFYSDPRLDLLLGPPDRASCSDLFTFTSLRERF